MLAFTFAMADPRNSSLPEIRVIWAVDPFAQDGDVQRNSAQAILSVTQRGPSRIEPVYICSDPRHQVPPKLRAQYCRELAYEGQDEVDTWTSGLRLKGLVPLKVLGPTTTSIREHVSTLLDHARNQMADLIVASTRAKKGPYRWFFGSFVETLSLTSDLPLLVVNPCLEFGWEIQGPKRF